ncbi:MAG: hypothetical protein WCY89_04025 [Flavobacteriaceae bacterium]
MKRISFLLIFVLMISCGKKKQEDIITIEEDVLKEDIIYKVNTESCKNFSDKASKFIKLLENDNYAVDFIQNQDSLVFKKPNDNDFDIEEKVVFYKDSFKSFRVKRKHPVDGSENTYPRFEVYEICFDNSEDVVGITKTIDEIINNDDIFNEKDYDFVLTNNNRIIYVSCNVNMFMEYVFSYKPKLEEIIQSSNEL